jgi:hypothetical protein
MDIDLLAKAFESLYDNKMQSKDLYRNKAKEYFKRSRQPNKVPKANGGFTSFENTFTPTPRKAQRREVEVKPLEPQES